MDDFEAHYNLKGAIFRRKMVKTDQLLSLSQLGLAAAALSHYSVLNAHFGTTLTSLGVVFFAMRGMVGLQERNIVNSIEFVQEGDHQGKLKINVSTGPFTSNNLFAEVKDCQALFS